ncbi:DUF393 domain-containing protein [Candidatus Gracilibacteria bacterium]|nr:DUF393 domain-containing protein [Candidatus Gracilibacteria bacterium]
MTTLPTEIVLVFDGTCGFCTRSLYLLQRFDRAGRITAFPFQAPGVRERYGLSIEECERAAWAIAPDGRRFEGAAAINMAFSVALALPLPLLFYVMPGVRHVQDGVYGWVAHNRSKLPGVMPYCTAHPEVCDLAAVPAVSCGLRPSSGRHFLLSAQKTAATTHKSSPPSFMFITSTFLRIPTYATIPCVLHAVTSNL